MVAEFEAENLLKRRCKQNAAFVNRCADKPFLSLSDMATFVQLSALLSFTRLRYKAFTSSDLISKLL